MLTESLRGRRSVPPIGIIRFVEWDPRRQGGLRVFYPLQTFSKIAAVDFKNVPICIESTDKNDRNTLKQIAEALDSPTYFINSEQRQALHLTAVFVNNFTNHLYRIAHELTDKKNLDFEILKPLIFETAKKVQHLSPYMAQTGWTLQRVLTDKPSSLSLVQTFLHYCTAAA